MPNEDPLRRLLDAAFEGDDPAVAELVRRTQPDVWRVCTALGSLGEEEDLVQETYLRVLGSMGSFRGDAPVRAWILAVARNVCADHVRKRTRHRRLVDRIEFFAVETSSPAADQSDPFALALLDDLTPERREAFELTQVVGLSYEEAAQVLGCPIGTVRSRVARARVSLAASARREAVE